MTERKRAEQGLAQAKEFTRSVLRSLPDHIGVLDRHGTLLYVNEAWSTFDRDYAKNSDRAGPGTDYLETCLRAPGIPGGFAEQAVAGIRGVLGGADPTFQLEYPIEIASETL